MEDGILVVGLGNPGAQYAGTRHNCGFMVLDHLAEADHCHTWQEKFLGETARISLGGERPILLKPMTFMNISGRSVSRAARYHRITPSEIIVVHDDLDLEYGTVRVKEGGGAGGHNGLSSCVQDLGSNAYLRVRIGIGRPVHGSATDFVLKPFSPDELPVLPDIIKKGGDAVESIIRNGVTKAMNEFNKRGGN